MYGLYCFRAAIGEFVSAATNDSIIDRRHHRTDRCKCLHAAEELTMASIASIHLFLSQLPCLSSKSLQNTCTCNTMLHKTPACQAIHNLHWAHIAVGSIDCAAGPLTSWMEKGHCQHTAKHTAEQFDQVQILKRSRNSSALSSLNLFSLTLPKIHPSTLF